MLVVLASLAYNTRMKIIALSVLIVTAHSTPVHAQLPHFARNTADLVVLYKEERLLQLKRNGHVIRSFHVALGLEPKGHKRTEGDGRTPEGVYTLDWRNEKSQFYRSIHVSYPRSQDQETAKRWGSSPGGMIMIHGLPNGRDRNELDHPQSDWTNGCIAVTNEEMDDIWSLVEDGTTIIIFP
ncbi:MAG: L,D-transpeptidase family protein [Geminicoccaceae bacterium]